MYFENASQRVRKYSEGTLKIPFDRFRNTSRVFKKYPERISEISLNLFRNTLKSIPKFVKTRYITLKRCSGGLK